MLSISDLFPEEPTGDGRKESRTEKELEAIANGTQYQGDPFLDAQVEMGWVGSFSEPGVPFPEFPELPELPGPGSPWPGPICIPFGAGLWASGHVMGLCLEDQPQPDYATPKFYPSLNIAEINTIMEPITGTQVEGSAADPVERCDKLLTESVNTFLALKWCQGADKAGDARWVREHKGKFARHWNAMRSILPKVADDVIQVHSLIQAALDDSRLKAEEIQEAYLQNKANIDARRRQVRVAIGNLLQERFEKVRGFNQIASQEFTGTFESDRSILIKKAEQLKATALSLPAASEN